MGMDVFGKNPRNETGCCFSRNVWSWRPIADYIEDVAPEIAAKCRHWHSNDGDGLNEDDALALTDRLQADLDSGRTEAYERRYTAALAMKPNVPCYLCGGTGTRKPVPEVGAGDIITGIKCNACDGNGILPDWDTHYPFKTDNVREFVAFLRGCGGFEIH
jgi:hypothetical protein